jgi:hypothetical protein
MSMAMAGTAIKDSSMGATNTTMKETSCEAGRRGDRSSQGDRSPQGGLRSQS